MKYPKFTRAFEVVSDLPPSLAPLQELAANYRWTWDHETRELFRAMDKNAWDASDHNPVLFLNSLSQERLERLSEDHIFLSRLNGCVASLREYMTEETWFDREHPGKREAMSVAYFCAEFGVSEGLPIYSGGLGVLAGDHLKAASDLGIPLVGVGLLYNRGYFRQHLNADGWQQEVYPAYDFYQMPLTLMRDANEKPIRIEVEFPDRIVSCHVWKAMVGRIPLYLMDSNVLENHAVDQGITDTLYGGDQDMRIRQEMILGIGGLKALRALGIAPTVCHMNEGHAAFLSIERIRQFMAENHCDFRTARQVIVSGNVFTTHTPVPAGFDKFPVQLLEQYMGKTVSLTGLPFRDFTKLGRVEKENDGEPFNMAVLAMENANWVNGVSKLHAAVTRGMFGVRWPGYPEDEVPVEPVTNGIHTGTWISRRFQNLFDEYLGDGWRRNAQDPAHWEAVDKIPDEELWAAMENQRGDLIRFVRKRLQRDMERRNNGPAEFGSVNSILDPRVLTIGFARRFATYKRGTLMLTDRERLKKVLFHPERPVQIVIAGKAHPRDDGGKKLIQELFHFINHEGARSRMVFLEDYDMRVARMLVQGVDVWLNNPRRPYEASGTSGMKVIPNGGLNCSVLDGWWDEAYDHSFGWAIGDRDNDPNEAHQDWLDSRALYSLIEHEISPIFYHRVESGVPKGWIAMVKRSIKNMAWQFSTNRMVAEYSAKFYVNSHDAYTNLKADGLSRAKAALAWRDKITSGWHGVRIRSVSDTAATSNAVGSEFCVKALVELGSLTTEDVRVQAIIGKVGPNRDLTNTTVVDLRHVGQDDGALVFEGALQFDQPGFQGYTLRVVPFHSDVAIPSELELVTWES